MVAVGYKTARRHIQKDKVLGRLKCLGITEFGSIQCPNVTKLQQVNL